MFCNNCGAELKEGSKFCTKCGAQQESLIYTEKITEKDGEATKEDSASGLQKAILSILIGIILVLVIVLVVLLKIKVSDSPEMKSDNNAMSVSEAEKMSDDNNGDGGEEIYSAKNAEKSEDNESNIDNEENDLSEEDDYILMIAVPADDVNLRNEPGFEDDNIVCTINAGTYLKWYGETKSAEDHDFYYVKCRDSDEEGYICTEYCVREDFEPDMNDLSIVGVENTLYTYDRMTEDIEKLCEEYPDIIKSRILGQSVDERNIYELTLGNQNAENHIFAQATIHGREYINSQLMMKMLEYYAFYYDTAYMDGVVYRDIFNQTCIHIIPMANPDGVVISTEGADHLNNKYLEDLVRDCYERDKYDLIYEKNTNGDWNWADKYKDETFIRTDENIVSYEEYQKLWKANADGVDLNRNFDVGWEDLKCRYIESYSDFRGYNPSSEPETMILMNLAEEHEYRAYISYHSMGQMIYYDAEGNKDSTSDMSTELADKFHSWLGYKKVSNKSAYNVVLGGFGDWVQLILNKPSITVESGRHPCPTSVEEFPGMWFRHMETWARLAREYYVD